MTKTNMRTTTRPSDKVSVNICIQFRPSGLDDEYIMPSANVVIRTGRHARAEADFEGRHFDNDRIATQLRYMETRIVNFIEAVVGDDRVVKAPYQPVSEPEEPEES